MSALQKTIFVFCASWFLALLSAHAETDYWSDNFETNAGSRWTTNSVWQVGSPTGGPATNSTGHHTYSGSRCATTSLKGNSPYSAFSRFICTNYDGSTYLTIPDAGQFPRLRYWQWYNFVNAGGVVEVQVSGTTNWQAISATNLSVGSIASSGGGVWSRPSIDMSAYAGQSVQIAFHFESGISFGTDLGWYVDDIALVTGDPVFNDPEGFEAGQGDWSVDAGTWQIGIPTSGPATNSQGFRAHSGTNCAATILAGNYGWNISSRLISASFTVPTSGPQSLSFWQWYKFINAGGVVEVNSGIGTTNVVNVTNVVTSTNTFISTNTTISITNFVTVTNYTYVTNIVITDISTNITTITTLGTNNWQAISQPVVSSGSTAASSNGQWTNTILDLSPFAGQTLQIAFHFESGISGYGNAAGWYIDDLSLVQLPTLTLPTTITITNGQKFTVTASASNPSLPSDLYNYRLAPLSTNAFITTNGTLNWTNTRPAFGTNLLTVIAADASQPALTATNSLSVIVNPVYSFSFTNALSSKQYFLLVLKSISNTTWQIDASTDLMNWQPVFTNKVTVGGLLEYTDLLATNFPYRFYRAVYP